MPASEHVLIGVHVLQSLLLLIAADATAVSAAGRHA